MGEHIPALQRFWAACKPRTKTQVAGLITEDGGDAEQRRILIQRKAREWQKDRWPDDDELISGANRLAAGLPMKPTVFPYLCQIAQHFHQNEPTHPAYRLLNQLFLRDAHLLHLYLPYAEDHRFARLLDWAYLPEVYEDDRPYCQRISQICAFNGDFHLYQHLYVVVDRTLGSPVHSPALVWFIPKLALMSTLFSLYGDAVELCDRAISYSRQEASPESPPWQRELLSQVLASIKADAEAQLMPADSLGDALVKPYQELLAIDKEIPDLRGDWADDLRRLRYGTYYRNLVRDVLQLRQRAREEQSRYLEDLPRHASDESFERYAELVEQHRQRVETNGGKGIDEAMPNYGAHYVGVDYDTLARYLAIVKMPLAIGSSNDLLNTGRRLRKVDHETASAIVSRAAGYHDLSKDWFHKGDLDDAEFLVGNAKRYAPNLDPTDVDCTLLSAYRTRATAAILQFTEALVSNSIKDFDFRKGEMMRELSALQSKIGVKRMKHSRFLFQNLMALHDRVRFDTRGEMISYKSQPRKAPFR